MVAAVARLQNPLPLPIQLLQDRSDRPPGDRAAPVANTSVQNVTRVKRKKEGFPLAATGTLRKLAVRNMEMNPSSETHSHCWSSTSSGDIFKCRQNTVPSPITGKVTSRFVSVDPPGNRTISCSESVSPALMQPVCIDATGLATVRIHEILRRQIPLNSGFKLH
jgi:hypothetical protein